MADKMRWRYGETNPVIGIVPSEVLVEIGDTVYYENDAVKPAGQQAAQSSTAVCQSTFAGKFLGIAMQHSPVGEMTPIRVATTGIFELDCKSNTFVIGSLVGVEDSNGMFVPANQKVALVTAGTGAIGRVVRREPVPTESVLVGIKSTITEGGIK